MIKTVGNDGPGSGCRGPERKFEETIDSHKQSSNGEAAGESSKRATGRSDPHNDRKNEVRVTKTEDNLETATNARQRSKRAVHGGNERPDRR